MYYGEHGAGGFVGEGGESEREGRRSDSRLRALRHPRPHTMGYIGECGQEAGVIEHNLPVESIRITSHELTKTPPIHTTITARLLPQHLGKGGYRGTSLIRKHPPP